MGRLLPSAKNPAPPLYRMRIDPSEADAVGPVPAAGRRRAAGLPDGSPARHVQPALRPVLPPRHAVAEARALQREDLQLHGRENEGIDPVVYYFATQKFRGFIVDHIKKLLRREVCSQTLTSQLSMDSRNQSQRNHCEDQQPETH